MTGIYALVGGVLTAAGVGGDVAVNYLAFGSFVGPHIAFAGGVAAAGYAGRKGKLASGTDILSSLNGLGEPDVLLVGGIFGVLGFLIHYCIGLLPVIGSAGPATTDLPGITVFILAVVTRLAFGKTRPDRPSTPAPESASGLPPGRASSITWYWAAASALW